MNVMTKGAPAKNAHITKFNQLHFIMGEKTSQYYLIVKKMEVKLVDKTVKVC